LKSLARFVGLGLLAFAALGLVFMMGMRRKSPAVLNTVRRASRASKPFMLKSAGMPGASASVIDHVGRTTGKPYETPVEAVETDDGFVIALPYGPNTDWLKNVLASGTANITYQGTTYRVDHPEVVPLHIASHHFSSKVQRTHRRFGVDECLTVRHAD
jgi:deazaflavin-dependent oxidoreductase (nitroreductase family)